MREISSKFDSTRGNRGIHKLARRKFRTLEQIWTNDFFLWPDEGISSDLRESVRHRAIAEVLCSIPEDDYEKLKETFKKGYGWFIPPYCIKSLINLSMPQSIQKR